MHANPLQSQQKIKKKLPSNAQAAGMLATFDFAFIITAAKSSLTLWGV